MRHTYSCPLRWADMDLLAHVNNVTYLDYVADVLPSLGEEGVQTCTLRDLVPEGPEATV